MFVETISIVYLIAAKEATNCTNENLSRKYLTRIYLFYNFMCNKLNCNIDNNNYYSIITN